MTSLLEKSLLSKNKNYYLIIFAISLLYISICQHVPVSIPTDAPHDHEMFFKAAISLIKGNWLGPYNQLTLTKGPTYKLFIALNYIFGLPITLTYAVFYLISSLILFYVCICLRISKILSLILFTAILFQPVLIQKELLRDDIVPSLFLISYSLLVLITVKPRRGNFVLILLCGVSFGLLYLTREDTVWIIPGVSVIILLTYIITRIAKNSFLNETKTLTAIFSISMTLILGVCVINKLYYGKFVNTELSGGPFSKTIQILTSINYGSNIPYVPVTKIKREKIYEVSPSFNRLKDYFEEKGLGWTTHGEKFYPWTKNEYAAGWFCWALRDAVASIGYYDSPNHADQFYNQILIEVQNAASKNEIQLSRKLPIALMPNINQKQMQEFIPSLIKSLKLVSMITLTEYPFTYYPSGNSSNKFQLYSTLLGHPPCIPPNISNNIEITGWYYPSIDQWIKIVCNDINKSEEKNVERMPSDDISKYFSKSYLDKNRFSISLNASSSNTIQSTVSGSLIDTSEIINAISNGTNNFYLADGSLLHIDSVNKPTYQSLYNPWIEALNCLSLAYHYIIPIIFTLGICSYLWVIFRFELYNVLLNPLFILSTSSWIFLISRLLLLCLVNISAFPALLKCYLLPAYILAIIAPISSLFLIISIKRNQFEPK